jgi:hypothetical protein
MAAKYSKSKASKQGPYLATSRAKKMPGKTVKTGGTQVMREEGKKPIAFKKGGLHAQLGVPQGEDIPASKKRAALAGKYGPLAKKRAVFAFKGALAKGRKTASK